MSEAKLLSSKPANFLVASKQEPRFDLRGMVNFDDSKDAATVVTANSLRAHQDVSVFRRADLFDGFVVNGVQMSDEHDGSGTANENEVALAKNRLALELFCEELEQLFLSGTQEVFKRFHAETSL